MKLTTSLLTLNLGAVDVAHESTVSIKPERLFGRHCAILGATGGGKELDHGADHRGVHQAQGES